MPPNSNAHFARTHEKKKADENVQSEKSCPGWWRNGRRVRIRCHFKDTEAGGVDSSLDLDVLKGMPPATEIQTLGSEMNFVLRICCGGFPGNHWRERLKKEEQKDYGVGTKKQWTSFPWFSYNLREKRHQSFFLSEGPRVPCVVPTQQCVSPTQWFWNFLVSRYLTLLKNSSRTPKSFCFRGFNLSIFTIGRLSAEQSEVFTYELV